MVRDSCDNRYHGLHLSPESFNYTIEVNNTEKGSRIVDIVASTTSWFAFQERIAKHLNVYPSSLHIQYRFSTDSKALPCDLTSQDNLDTMITLLRPLVVPPLLANGRRSTRQMKAVTVQIFNKDGGPLAASGDGKVHFVSIRVTLLICVISERELQ
jgi:hypothetical protein